MSCPTCGRRSTSLVLPEGFEYDPPVRGGAAPPGGSLDAPVQRQLPIRLNQAWKDFIDRHGDGSIPNQGAVVADGAEAVLVLSLETLLGINQPAASNFVHNTDGVSFTATGITTIPIEIQTTDFVASAARVVSIWIDGQSADFDSVIEYNPSSDTFSRWIALFYHTEAKQQGTQIPVRVWAGSATPRGTSNPANVQANTNPIGPLGTSLGSSGDLGVALEPPPQFFPAAGSFSIQVRHLAGGQNRSLEFITLLEEVE